MMNILIGYHFLSKNHVSIIGLKSLKNFDLMLEIAKQLATPFSYVRVDLYNIDGNIYFGELNIFSWLRE
ncbi:hypothetical protein PROPEN_00698 [Proteus penneri ATCC 35198]|nr:hypothetical protein PROPEN_00698 [Proteus penneri ATCC 35198]